MSGAGVLLLALVAADAAPGVLASDARDDQTRLTQALELDRLIQTGDAVDPDLLVRQFTWFRNEVTILLAAHPKRPVSAWAQLMARSNVGDNHWLTMANALLRARAPTFADYLLRALPTSVKVVASDTDADNTGEVGMMTGTPIRSAGPPRPCYELDRLPLPDAPAPPGESLHRPRIPQPAWVRFSEGPYPVYYRRDERDGRAVNCGRCRATPTGTSARAHLRGYLAVLSGVPEHDLEPLFDHSLASPAGESLAQVEGRARARHAEAWKRVTTALLDARLIERPPPLPRVTIAADDLRHVRD